MREVNQSNVAISLKKNQVVQQDQDQSVRARDSRSQINPNQTPLVTENVPMTNHLKQINRCYILLNIVLNMFYIALLVVLVLSLDIVVIILVSIFAIISYISYIIAAYNSTNLIFLLSMQHQDKYTETFNNLIKAKCKLIFTYVAPRNHIDQAVTKTTIQYENIKIQDRSGSLYKIQHNYKVVAVKYHKKYYYESQQMRRQVKNAFTAFVASCKEKGDKRSKLLSGDDKISFQILGMKQQIGFQLDQSNCYKFMYIATTILGFGAYFQIFMKDKVLRYQMQIVKQICHK